MQCYFVCMCMLIYLCPGEFGIVYRAHLSSYEGRSEPGVVAVKTLKGVNIKPWMHALK